MREFKVKISSWEVSFSFNAFECKATVKCSSPMTPLKYVWHFNLRQGQASTLKRSSNLCDHPGIVERWLCTFWISKHLKSRWRWFRWMTLMLNYCRLQRRVFSRWRREVSGAPKFRAWFGYLNCPVSVGISAGCWFPLQELLRNFQNPNCGPAAMRGQIEFGLRWASFLVADLWAISICFCWQMLVVWSCFLAFPNPSYKNRWAVLIASLFSGVDEMQRSPLLIACKVRVPQCRSSCFHGKTSRKSQGFSHRNSCSWKNQEFWKKLRTVLWSIFTFHCTCFVLFYNLYIFWTAKRRVDVRLQAGHLDVVRCLLEAHADVNRSSPLSLSKTGRWKNWF